MKKLHLEFILLLIILLVSSTVVSAGVDWREITPAELAMKTPKVEADADAEAIFWEVRIDAGDYIKLVLSHYVRVKIFTERGREKFSKIDVPFVKGGSKIKELAARIIRPDGSFIEIGKDDVFEREVVKVNKVKVRAKSFAVPNIEPGVIVEYQYQEQIEGMSAIGMFLNFQREIPVQNLTYYYKPFNKDEPNYQFYNFNDTKFVKDEKKYYRATRTNVPAFKAESQMPPEDSVRSWGRLQRGYVRSIISKDFTTEKYIVKDSNDPSIFWGAFGFERSGWVKYMNKPETRIKNTAEQITASATNDEDKLRMLYEFVQTQIKNTSYDSTIDDEAQKEMPKTTVIGDVLENRQANARLIDAMFGALANSLGFETRLAYTADRSKVIFKPEMTDGGFLHIAGIAAKVGGKWKFFKPGDKFLPYGRLLWSEEDVWALTVGEEKTEWVKTPLAGYDETVSRRTGKLKLFEDGTLEGNVRIEHNGHKATEYRIENFKVSQNQREENLIQEIKSQISTAEISDIRIENLEANDKPFVYQYKIRIPNYAQKTGKRLFIQPSFFEYGEKPLFSGATRKYDIYFHYPWSEIDEIEYELPAGYKLDNPEIPSDVYDKEKIGFLGYKVLASKDATVMIFNRKFHFGGGNNTLFNVSGYQVLKQLFDDFHKADSQPITLKQME